MNGLIIDRVTLVGCRNIGFDTIDTIDIEMSNPFQVILGTNGAGKSVLISQLNPLPGKPKQFRKNGSKTIHLRFNGKPCVLHSVYDKGTGHHSFKIEGDEQNQGGTISIQRELCATVFGIDSFTEELLSGSFKFTELTESKRKALFGRMDAGNIGYALSVYQKLERRYKDVCGYLKIRKERLANDLTDIDGIKEKESRIRQDTDRLSDYIRTLASSGRGTNGNISNVLRTLSELSEKRNQVAETFLKTKMPSLDKAGGIDYLNGEIETLENEYVVLTTTVNSAIDEYQRLTQRIAKLKAIDSKQQLLTEQQTLTRNLDELTVPDVPFDTTYFDPKQLVEAINDFMIVYNGLPVNEHGYSHDMRVNINRKLDTAVETLRRDQESLSGVNHKIDHIKHANHTTCPKCQYRWSDVTGDIDALNRDHDRLSGNVAAMQSIISELKEHRLQLEQYLSHRQSISEVANKWNQYRDLWLAIKPHLDTKDDCVLTYIKQYTDRLHALKKQKDYSERLTSVNQQIEYVKQLESESNGALEDEQRVEYLDEHIATLTDKIRSNRRRVDDYKAKKRQLVKLMTLYETILELDKEILLTQKSFEDNVIDQYQRTAVNTAQRQLTDYNGQLNKLASSEEIIKQARKDIAEHEQLKESYESLMSALSPRSGIIADRMRALTSGLVKDVNEIVSKIYSYPLDVLDCGTLDDSLDYLFPVLVNGSLIEVEDVKFCSKGQQEILNFAFGIVIQSYMGLNGFPVYADEPGTAQSVDHLRNMTEYMKNMVSVGECHQLFMISHTAAGYGLLNTAHKIVLTNHGHNLMDGANQDASITYC